METLENILTKISRNKVRAFIVASNSLLSGLALYKALEYASNGETGKATVAGVCSMITAYCSGYNTKRSDI